MLSLSRLKSLLDQVPQLTIGLVGDLFLDRYLEIVPGIEEMSIETGLEAYQIDSVRNSPGALGTVMNNLAAIGVGRLVPLTVLGDDGHGYDLRQQLAELPVDPQYIISDPDRLTPTYTKPLKPTDVERVELNRLDVRTRAPLSEQTTQQLCEHLRHAIDQIDGLIVLDQINETNWGVVNDQVRECLAKLSPANPDKLIYVDSRQHIGRFSFGTLKGNSSEFTAACNLGDTDENAKLSATQLCEKTNRAVFCTLGEQGTAVALPNEGLQLVPGFQVTGPIDIVGAGDSATSGIVTSLLTGVSAAEAAQIGNLIASITIQQLGTTGTASPEQILDRWRETNQDAETS